MLLLRGLGVLIKYGGFPVKSINPLLRLKMKKNPGFSYAENWLIPVVWLRMENGEWSLTCVPIRSGYLMEEETMEFTSNCEPTTREQITIFPQRAITPPTKVSPVFYWQEIFMRVTEVVGQFPNPQHCSKLPANVFHRGPAVKTPSRTCPVSTLGRRFHR